MKIDACTIQIEEEEVNSVLNTVQLNTRITYFGVGYHDPFHSLIFTVLTTTQYNQLIYLCITFASKIVTWKPKVILICDPTIEDAIFDIVNVENEWVSRDKTKNRFNNCQN